MVRKKDSQEGQRRSHKIRNYSVLKTNFSLFTLKQGRKDNGTLTHWSVTKKETSGRPGLVCPLGYISLYRSAGD